MQIHATYAPVFAFSEYCPSPRRSHGLSSIAIIIGVTMVGLDYRRRTIYALGIALVLVYILGYVAWHVSGHGGFLPNRRPLYHGMAPLVALIAHPSTSPRAFVSKVADITILGVLVHLHRREA